MTAITLKEAAGMLGYRYNRFRILRAQGAFRLIKTMRYTDNSREKVIKETVEDQMRHSVIKL